MGNGRIQICEVHSLHGRLQKQQKRIEFAYGTVEIDGSPAGTRIDLREAANFRVLRTISPFASTQNGPDRPISRPREFTQVKRGQRNSRTYGLAAECTTG